MLSARERPSSGLITHQGRACVAACPFGAVEIRESDGVSHAWVDAAKCKGCGACVAVCPTEAIQLKGFSNDQIRTMIEVMGRDA